MFVKQGWLGLPLFFLGLATLAFSQLETEADVSGLTANEISDTISSSIVSAENELSQLRRELANKIENEISNLKSKISSGILSNENEALLVGQIDDLKERFHNREKSISSSLDRSDIRINDAKDIFADLQDNFAGRMEESRTALLALHKNLAGMLVELKALSTMSSGFSKDLSHEITAFSRGVDNKLSSSPPIPAEKSTTTQPTTNLARKISSVIRAREALPLRNPNKLTKQVKGSNEFVFGKLSGQTTESDDDMILKLKKELDDSKSFQTELSADTAELKSDLRKAYREIVSLQTNLSESKLIIGELENAKRSLYQTGNGGPATAQSVSKEINRLERDLERARDDLRQSRQSLLIEQQRSNSMISSITTELERTRRELDYSRQMAQNNGANFERLSFLERELAIAKRALESAQQKPIDPESNEFVNLQDELRKSLGEIARMQIELSEKGTLEDELLRLKSSMELMEDTPSRSASPDYVNKLLVELNAANTEIERLQEGNLAQRKGISEDVVILQDQLQSTQKELEQIRHEFADTKEDIAKREFDFASTIKKLEEESQLAESILQQTAEGKIPIVPFVTEMEEDLSASESRIRLLSDQFANEQKRASDVIEELTKEIELAQARNKQSLDQLGRRELELTAKSQEVASLSERKKELEEELEVVTVIAGQLQDLNQVLEETKKTQSAQSQSGDQVIDSLKNELNRAKIELVVALEEKDKLQEDFSKRFTNLEMLLEDTKNEMYEEKEIFAETTNESKILVNELRTELEAARANIAQMKRSGITESIDTKEAVSQLQEALGTIKILQESLRDAEAANLEVDNLRSELADVMADQLEKFQDSEDEKLKLRSQINNLEAEVALLRDSNGNSQATLAKSNADLLGRIKSSEAQINLLKSELANSEGLGVNSLILLEDELAEVKGENALLTDRLKSSEDNSNYIYELEDSVSLLTAKLDSLDQSSSSDLSLGDEDTKFASAEGLGLRAITILEDELAQVRDENSRLLDDLKQVEDNSNYITDLESKLTSLTAELNILEQDNMLPDELISLKNENKELNEELIRLQTQLDESSEFPNPDQDLLVKTMDLEMKLEMALAQLSAMETAESPSSSDPQILEELEQEITRSNSTINDLNQQIENMIARQAETELEMAMLENSSIQSQKDNPDTQENKAIQKELESLKEELSMARKISSESTSRGPEMNLLQDQLRDAVAESFELQMELEQTRDRLSNLEQMAQTKPSSDTIEKISQKANEAQANAQIRINELTESLKNSELLRKETEDLVTALEKRALASNDISNDPRFIEIQQEMLALQNDLISIQQMTDPRVEELEKKLKDSRENGIRLNKDLGSVMSEFSSLKSGLKSLEDENRKLRDISLANARNQANEVGVNLQKQINDLTRENTSLANQVGEKDSRIQGLRDELSANMDNRRDSTTRNQLLQLQTRLQEAEDARNQAKLETQRVREELEFANRTLASLQSRIRDFDKDNIISNPPINPELLAENEELKSQNNLLKEQLAAISSVPPQNDMEDRIKDLNQRNLTLAVQLDQEGILIEDLKNELSNARAIKQEVLERGKSSQLKVELLNDELSDARNRVQSLEKALIAAREAIRVLQGGGNQGSMVQVSNPRSFSENLGNQRYNTVPSSPQYAARRQQSLPEYNPVRPRNIFPTPSNPVSIMNDDGGSANLQIQAKVQFLDNKIRPAGFTEFFLVDRDLSDVLSEDGINPPSQDGIQSHAEYWARSVQRGYQFPGIAAKIRNALARSSLRRIKTNSLGVGNVDDLSDGRYYIIGASTLGQVGVVWSKSINLNDGDNIIKLDLKDAVWAQ